jgi:hypothetical protein
MDMGAASAKGEQMTGFEAFPKIARLFREVTITEKIDGTNAVVSIGNRKMTITASPSGLPSIRRIC